MMGRSRIKPGAPTQTGNYPTLLNGLAARPPWQVAGVDFYVGCPAGLAIKDPTTQGPAGTNYSPSGSIRNFNITGNNVLIDGFDFSLHSGIGVFISGNNCTIQNCNFVNGTYGGSYQIDVAGLNCIIQNCTVDGSGGGTTWQASLIKHEAASLLTLSHNWFKNFPQQVVECIHGSTDHYSIDYEYNLIDEGGLFIGTAHLNYLQQNNGICDSCLVKFNTGRQVTSVGGEGFQFYMGGSGGGTMNNIDCNHNTFYGLPQPGSSGGSGVSIASYFHGPTADFGPTTGTGWSITNNYALFFPKPGGFSQSCNFVFYTSSFNTFTNSGNIDMFNGKTIALDNTES